MNIMLNDVQQVYVGAANKCCCGCSGNHRYATAHRKVASKNRGYTVDDHEVNDRQVKKVVSFLEQHPEAVTIHNGFISAEVDGKMYVAYFVKK